MFSAPETHSVKQNQSAWIATAAGQPLTRTALDKPSLSTEEVEVAVEHCGLCYSDLAVLQNDWGNTRYPVILGHEVIGRVTALGANAKGVQLGQRVGIGWNASSCMHCRPCLSGNQHLCPQIELTVAEHRGGFASHIHAHWAWVIPLPDGLDAAEAGPLLCAGVTVFAPLIAHAKPSSRVGIIGIGGLGHLALQVAASVGCEITAFTSTESKFAEARALGAHHVVSSNNAQALEKQRGRLDLLISTVNVKLDWGALIATLAPQGRLHFLGPVSEPVPVAAAALILQQRSVAGSVTGAPVTMADMLLFAARNQIVSRNEHFPMRDANSAIARLASGKARYRIVLDADF
jgi:uncharacterized zinc-type alcohol dehydrogenase-like protein